MLMCNIHSPGAPGNEGAAFIPFPWDGPLSVWRRRRRISLKWGHLWVAIDAFISLGHLPALIACIHSFRAPIGVERRHLFHWGVTNLLLPP